MAKRSFNPLEAQKQAQEFIVGYLSTNEIPLPPAMTTEDYKKSMDAVTQAMALAWSDGYWKGRG